MTALIDNLPRRLAAQAAAAISTALAVGCSAAPPAEEPVVPAPTTQAVASGTPVSTSEPKRRATGEDKSGIKEWFSRLEPEADSPPPVKESCCKGKNECKAKGNCKVEGDHDCKGLNECKGHGGCRGAEDCG